MIAVPDPRVLAIGLLGDSAAPLTTLQWCVYVGMMMFGLIGSASVNGLETALYSLSRVRLMVRRSRGERAAIVLRRELDDLQGAISTILISNNGANFLISFAVTAILTSALDLGDWSTLAIEAVLLTPFLFVFTETLPKEVSRAHPDSVAYPFAVPLYLHRMAFTAIGLLPLVRLIGERLPRWFSGRREAEAMSARARVAALIEEGVGHGVISEQQTEIVERVFAMRDVAVRDTLIPWSDVLALPRQLTLDDLTSRRGELIHSRYPVTDPDTGRVVGVLNLLDVLTSPIRPQTIGAAVTPALFLRPDEGLRAAIAAMFQAGTPIAVVGSPDARPLGLVTGKDLLEPLLGEIAAG